MENLALKIRLSVLWIFTEVAALTSVVLFFFEPGGIEEVMSGVVEGMEMGPEMLLLFAIMFLIPLVMAVLSLTLKDKANRWANIIAGIVFTGLYIIDLIEHLASPSAHTILLVVSAVVATALIVWYAWKWPKQED
jgi:hypothetical protein